MAQRNKVEAKKKEKKKGKRKRKKSVSIECGLKNKERLTVESHF